MKTREEMRFEAAKAAMQGYLASYVGLANDMPSEMEVSKNCVSYADALLAELDRTAPKPETPQPDADEWIPHNPGDPMPCDGDTMVFVKLRSGAEWDDPSPAKFWDHPDFEESNWNEVGDPSIVAWKPAK